MNKLQERMFDINKRKAEIRSQVEANAEGIDLDALTTELKNLDTEFTGIEKRMKLVDGITIEKPKEEINNMEDKTYTRDSKEYRSAFLKHIQGVKLNEVEQRAYSSASDSAGAAIPTQTADQLISKIKQVAPILNEMTLLQVAGDVRFATEGVRDSAALHTENATVNPAGDTVMSVNLGGYEYIKVISVSKTIQTMAIDAFEGWLTNILSEDIARQIENAAINGTGSSQPTGVEKANTWDETNSFSVAAASSLTYANVCSFIGLLKGGYDYNAKFLMSKKTLYEDFITLQDKSKNDLVVRDAVNGTYVVMGYPVMLSDSVKEHDAYLGNFRYLVGNLSQNITVDSSAESGFRNNSIDFRGSAMFDCKPALGEAFVKLTKATAA